MWRIDRDNPTVRLIGSLGPEFGIAAALFLLGFLFGYSIDGTDVNQSATPEQTLDISLQFFDLVTNNALVYFLLILGGVTFGLTTLMFLLTTSVTGGVVISAALANGVHPIVLAALVLPHGILEIPAYFLGAAIGFRTVREVIQYLRGRHGRPFTTEQLYMYASLIVVGFILIVISAWIEANITIPVSKLVKSLYDY